MPLAIIVCRISEVINFKLIVLIAPTGLQFAMDEVSCPRRNFMSLLDCNFDRQHNCARGEEMVLECVGGAVNGAAGFQVNTRPAVPISQSQQIARPIGGQLANHKLVEVTGSRPNKVLYLGFK